MRHRHDHVLRMLGLLLLLSSGQAQAAAVVERGDVLSVTVAEEPKLDGQAKVGADGRIMLPQVGGLDVAGSDLEAIRQRIERALVERDIILAPTVTVEIATYRPFYVGGAVARPGAVAYDPGLTVRHALVLAGGLEIADSANGLSGARLIEIRAKWRSSAYQLLQADARIARLRAELENASQLDLDGVDTRTVRDADAATVLSLETQQLSDRLAEQAGSKAHLKDVMAQIDLEVDVLTQQAKLQQQESALQQDEVENARTLYEKGLIPRPRLQELEREASRLSRDLLENRAFEARARQNQADVRYEISAAETQRRLDVRRELVAALADRTRLDAEMQALSASLMAAGVVLDDVRSDAAPAPVVTIYRTVAGKDVSLAGTMSTPILPGDLLDVALAGVPQG